MFDQKRMLDDIAKLLNKDGYKTQGNNTLAQVTYWVILKNAPINQWYRKNFFKIFDSLSCAEKGQLFKEARAIENFSNKPIKNRKNILTWCTSVCLASTILASCATYDTKLDVPNYHKSGRVVSDKISLNVKPDQDIKQQIESGTANYYVSPQKESHGVDGQFYEKVAFIEFGNDSSTLTQKELLNSLSHGDYVIVGKSHGYSRKSVELLAAKRANAIKDYLVNNKGFSPEQIKTMTYYSGSKEASVTRARGAYIYKVHNLASFNDIFG